MRRIDSNSLGRAGQVGNAEATSADTTIRHPTLLDINHDFVLFNIDITGEDTVFPDEAHTVKGLGHLTSEQQVEHFYNDLVLSHSTSHNPTPQALEENLDVGPVDVEGPRAW